MYPTFKNKLTVNKQTYNRRKRIVSEDIAEQVSQRRNERSSQGSLLGNNVKSVSVIPTDINGFKIPTGTEGKVIEKGKWFDVYNVNFYIHNLEISVWCNSDAIAV